MAIIVNLDVMLAKIMKSIDILDNRITSDCK
ncbi:hypothetical protein SAMN05661091_2548 [Paenibacillus uliginis N3/975]|uniref:Uncharacterized protein n=1 Tax=Paenibacillus uliginis N3/975 TaxID=1313296 RepID=A0A1X7HCV6_9BACL|nr:hypothetical protein SAMN05661091_2548 [Paenibacillus uliginis N3/975]